MEAPMRLFTRTTPATHSARRLVAFGSALVLTATALVAVVPHAHAASTSFDYAEALQDSMFFYATQRSGQLAPDNPVDWRGDSDLSDGSDNGVDLTGGYHDAGDLVKFGLPEAYSMTQLAWGYLDFPQGYASAGTGQQLLETLRWGDDYILSAFTNATTFYGQVANPNTDHQYWGPAEVNPVARPSYAVTASCGGTDLAAEAAAALASSSIVFQTSDPKYSAELLTQAQGLWNFANTERGDYSDCITLAQGFYNSFSGYWTQLVEGAIWLYKATGTSSWLTTAETDYASMPLASQSTLHEYAWTSNWDDDSFSDYIMLAELTGQQEYITDAEDYLNWWTTGFNGSEVSYSPGGEAFLNQWGSLRYSANAAYTALEFSDYLSAHSLSPTLVTTYHNFAVTQIDYILGANPNDESYEVGFTNGGASTAWPQQPHNSTAHGSWADNLTTPAQTRHVDYGLLVGGPTSDNDQFQDQRSEYQYTEGALDYNAMFSGALAALTQQYGGTPVANFPKAELPDGPQQYIQASINNQSTNFIELKVLINNQSAWPAQPMTDASFRYYFTLDAGETASQITLSSSYNQCNAPGAPTQFSGSTYYVTVNCSNLNIEPVGEADYTNDDWQAQVQVRITFPQSHNPAEDWSFQGIPSTVGATPVTVSDIPLYSGNTLVWGTSPSAATGPSTPGTLSAGSVTGTGATLSWTASTAGMYPIAGYDVYSSAGRLVAQVPATTTSYAVTGLNSKRTSPYGFYVDAVDTQGTASAASNIAQFITASFTSLTAGAATAPGTPGTPVPKSISSAGATLTWGASTPGTHAVSAYDVYELYPTARLVAAVSSTTSSYTLTGLSPTTAYGYEVAALDGTGRISTVTAATAFTTLSGVSSTPTPTPSASVSASVSATASPTASASASASPTSTPSHTSSPTASPTATAPGGGAGTCSAVFSITNSWSGGFQASVTVTAGSSAITGWTVRWTFPSGEAVTSLWSGSDTVSGQVVTVTNESYNGSLGAGADTSFGFTASDPGASTPPATVSCTAAG
jgi:endoglucanase